MEAIKDTIQAVMQAIQVGKAASPGIKIEGLLKKNLTKKELKHIKLNYFKGGVLGLKVGSSTWLYQFNLQKENLLKNLRNDLPGLKDIRFSIGEISKHG